MKLDKYWNKYGNCVIIVLTVVVNIIAMSFCFDYYYDLNDDVMMKDVMAGVYAGTPDGHNMQTLYPLGAFISLLYKLFRTLPWYGTFLWLCQIGSLFLIGYRLLGLLKKWQAKLACMLLMTLFIWGVLLPHMIALQYTITCTMLASAAIFLFMTTKRGLNIQQFILYNIPSILLVILAYQLRSEMLLLVFPFIGLAGLYKWAEEEKFFNKENYIKYGIVIACILVGMLVSRLIDYAAYSGENWKAAVDFFNSRTEVYDFHYDILTSGEHAEYLASIGLSDAQQELLANYNFGLDEDIDAELMAEIAKYAASDTIDDSSLTKRVFDRMSKYIYRTLHGGDFPYNLLIIAGYACVFVSGMWSALKRDRDRKRWNFLWELVLLGIVRTVLWMYILIKDRDPERITHSLYLAESMVLMGVFCMRHFLTTVQETVDMEAGFSDNNARSELEVQSMSITGNVNSIENGKFGSVKFGADLNVIPSISLLLIVLICFSNLTNSITATRADANKREAANRGAYAISQYCSSQPQNFYFEDVYSTVSFSQKIFKSVDNSITNYDIMGGWMCKTPLYGEKLRRYGLGNTQDALLKEKGVYFIIEIPDMENDTYSGPEWMVEYYHDKGFSVDLKQIDVIDSRFAVFQVVEE
ncbi:MAG: hypothetical protein HDR03_07360 [Lachnospiraceae bacterium]|nr:hypothetical protein [Lachnospiraceae bacterium]